MEVYEVVNAMYDGFDWRAGVLVGHVMLGIWLIKFLWGLTCW